VVRLRKHLAASAVETPLCAASLPIDGTGMNLAAATGSIPAAYAATCRGPPRLLAAILVSGLVAKTSLRDLAQQALKTCNPRDCLRQPRPLNAASARGEIAFDYSLYCLSDAGHAQRRHACF